MIFKDIYKIVGVAQNHSALFMSSRERLPGLLHGQIYTYPSKRWRKKRRQYLMHYLHPKRPRGDIEDGTEGVEAVMHINDDSKDSVVLKGKQGWRNTLLNTYIMTKIYLKNWKKLKLYIFIII